MSLVETSNEHLAVMKNNLERLKFIESRVNFIKLLVISRKNNKKTSPRHGLFTSKHNKGKS